LKISRLAARGQLWFPGFRAVSHGGGRIARLDSQPQSAL